MGSYHLFFLISLLSSSAGFTPAMLFFHMHMFSIEIELSLPFPEFIRIEMIQSFGLDISFTIYGHISGGGKGGGPMII